MSWGAEPRFSASERPGEALLSYGILEYHLVLLPDPISKFTNLVHTKKQKRVDPAQPQPVHYDAAAKKHCGSRCGGVMCCVVGEVGGCVRYNAEDDKSMTKS